MILVGNSRGGARNLADHLMKDENDHVTVHELRGFASDNLHGAMNETYAISRGTKCEKFLFSLSLNPPPNERVETPVFENAIDRVEDRLGLTDQPRAIVFHEKDGRRHAHAVWSRIDAETMTARRMDFSRERMQEVARDLYREHGWQMPEGFADRTKSDPRNFTLEQWQQAKRVGKDAGQVKEAFQDAWAISDSRSAFEHALKERGYHLARGDKRGFVAVDTHGEVYSVPKQVDVRTKQIKERLGDPKELPALEQARDAMAQDIGQNLGRLYNEQVDQAHANKERYQREKAQLVEEQRVARERLMAEQCARALQEQAERQDKFRRGFLGLWDRITGQHRRIAEQNKLETIAAQQRDQEERDAISFEQLERRREIQLEAREQHQEIKNRAEELEADKQRYLAMRMAEASLPSREPEVTPQQSRAPPEPEPTPAPQPEPRQSEQERYVVERQQEVQAPEPERQEPTPER